MISFHPPFEWDVTHEFSKHDLYYETRLINTIEYERVLWGVINTMKGLRSDHLFRAATSRERRIHKYFSLLSLLQCSAVLLRSIIHCLLLDAFCFFAIRRAVVIMFVFRSVHILYSQMHRMPSRWILRRSLCSNLASCNTAAKQTIRLQFCLLGRCQIMYVEDWTWR